MESNNTDHTRPTPAESEPDELGKTVPSQVNLEPAQEELNITQATLHLDGAPLGIPPEPVKKKRGSFRWWLWAILGVLLLVLIAAGSLVAGSLASIPPRLQLEGTAKAQDAAVQFNLALQDIATGNYTRAQQRLEYVIQIDPNFPNAADTLASVLIELRITATATIVPTPTLTPTPDTRGRDELYSQAQNLLLVPIPTEQYSKYWNQCYGTYMPPAHDWSSVIETLLTLRKRYPDFNPVQVDGLLYVALRNRGVERISVLNDLEGGTYDLALAERFGPLDSEANNYRDWAEMYIRGASYWNVDWAQTVYYFSELMLTAPNLRDASCWSSTDRYLKSLLGYGDYLAKNGDWCGAQTQYDTYMTLIANPEVEPTAVYVADQCSQGGTTDTTPVPPLDGVTPTPTLTPSPTSDTGSPGGTPYP